MRRKIDEFDDGLKILEPGISSFNVVRPHEWRAVGRGEHYILSAKLDIAVGIARALSEFTRRVSLYETATETWLKPDPLGRRPTLRRL